MYQTIAKQYGISVDETERGIKAIIKVAYENPEYYAECILKMKEARTPKTFILYMANTQL